MIEMNLETCRTLAGYSTLFGYLILAVWAVVFIFARNWHYRVVRTWFRDLTERDHQLANLYAIAFFKVLLMIAFLIPYLAMLAAGR